MSDLYWLTDEQMDKLTSFFAKSHGKPRVDDRRLLSEIIFINRSRLRWRGHASVAAHHNPKLRSFALRLRKAGKPDKGIITAVAGKLFSIANTLCNNRQKWVATAP